MQGDQKNDIKTHSDMLSRRRCSVRRRSCFSCGHESDLLLLPLWFVFEAILYFLQISSRLNNVLFLLRVLNHMYNVLRIKATSITIEFHRCESEEVIPIICSPIC